MYMYNSKGRDEKREGKWQEGKGKGGWERGREGDSIADKVGPGKKASAGRLLINSVPWTNAGKNVRQTV